MSQHPFWFQWQCSTRWCLLNHSRIYQEKISKKGWKGTKIQAWASSCDGCLFTNMSSSAALSAGAVCEWWITEIAGALPRAVVRRAKQWECTRLALQAQGTEPPNAAERRHSELSFIIHTTFKAYGCLLLFFFFIFNVNACKQVLQTAHPSVRQSIWLSPSSWKNEVWQALVTLIKPLQGARKGALGWGAAEGFRAHSYNPGLCQREAALYLVVVWCWIAASSCCVSSQPIVLIILNGGVQIKALLGFWTVLVLQHCLSSLERPGDAEPLWSIAREMRIWAVGLGNGNLHPSLGAAVVIPPSY